MSLLIGASSPAQGASGAQGAAADLGETIDQSLRFTGAGRLVSADTKPSGDYTFAFWWKRGDDPQGSSLDSLLTFTPNGGYQCVEPQRGNNSGISVRDGATLRDITDGTLPDYSAWYHICIISESGTSRCYVNGVKQSNTGAEPTGGAVMCIGSNQIASQDDALVGYLAEFNLLDGTVVGDTNDILDEFGRVNDDGVWVPKEISFTSAQYGAKGFRLVFDSSADGGIGDDSAPTGTGHTAANDFTASGFQTTSTHENYDLDYNDTPTSNYSTLNALRSAATTGRGTQDANLTLDGVDETWAATPGTCAQNSGKRFFEMEVSSSGSGANNNFIGFASADCRFNINALQDDSTEGAKGRILLCDDGKTKLDNAARQTYTSNIAASNVIGCLIDFDDEEVEFFRNGTSLGAIDISSSPLVDGRMVLPVNIVIGSPHNTHDQYLNYGQRDFQHAPTGVTAADNGFETNNLPEPTIKNGKEHFEAKLYSGTGSSNAITGLEFSPDFIWIKVRDAADNHVLVDTIRGTDSVLFSNSADAEASSFSRFTSFDSNGFTVDSSDTAWNNSSNNYVAWCWKAGGTAVSNTNGTITSSVSANTDAGFSIVSWTGTQTASQTVGHGLTQAPDLVIYKARDEATNWIVGSSAIGATEYLILDVTNAATSNSTYIPSRPTSSVLNLGSVSSVNNDERMIAYCWHSVEGFSKFGSYTGNGSTDGSFVYLGFKPALIILKSSSNAFDWQIYDTTRSPTNPALLTLNANLNGTGASSGNDLDILSNGFKARDNGSINNNSGSTYLYMAWAENPFGGENAPPATAR